MARWGPMAVPKYVKERRRELVILLIGHKVLFKIDILEIMLPRECLEPLVSFKDQISFPWVHILHEKPACRSVGKDEDRPVPNALVAQSEQASRHKGFGLVVHRSLKLIQ